MSDLSTRPIATLLRQVWYWDQALSGVERGASSSCTAMISLMQFADESPPSPPPGVEVSPLSPPPGVESEPSPPPGVEVLCCSLFSKYCATFHIPTVTQACVCRCVNFSNEIHSRTLLN